MKLVVLAILGLMISLNTAAQSQPVVVITNNWTSQVVLSHVYGSMLKELGIGVRYLPSSVSDQWGALTHGAAHVQIEVWEGTMNQAFNRLTGQGHIENMGTHSAKTREDWWYPDYVESRCPGLPNWRALKTCSSIFAKSFGGKGIYVAGPWEKPDEARIRALGLNFDVHPVERGDDLWVELKAAVAQHRPIVLFNWSPNWVESRYKGKFVEFPTFEEACETDPKWGVNPDYLYDCGNPKGGWLKKAAWPGLKNLSQCAYSLLKAISLDNEQISEAAAFVDVDKLSYEMAAKKWMNKHSRVWRAWMEVCD